MKITEEITAICCFQRTEENNSITSLMMCENVLKLVGGFEGWHRVQHPSKKSCKNDLWTCGRQVFKTLKHCTSSTHVFDWAFNKLFKYSSIFLQRKPGLASQSCMHGKLQSVQCIIWECNHTTFYMHILYKTNSIMQRRLTYGMVTGIHKHPKRTKQLLTVTGSSSWSCWKLTYQWTCLLSQSPFLPAKMGQSVWPTHM